MINQKHCWKCDTTKQRDDFSTNVARDDGLQVYCKTCRALYARYIRAHVSRRRKRAS